MHICQSCVLGKNTLLPTKPQDGQNLHLPAIHMDQAPTAPCNLQQNSLFAHNIGRNQTQHTLSSRSALLLHTLDCIHNVIHRLILGRKCKPGVAVRGVQKHRVSPDELQQIRIARHRLRVSEVAGVDILLGVRSRGDEEELDGAGAVVGVDGGDAPTIDSDTDADLEDDDELRRDGEHGGEEARGERRAEDEAAAPGRAEAGVVVGVEVGEEVGDGEVAGVAEGVNDEAGARDEGGGRHRGGDGLERRGGGGGERVRVGLGRGERGEGGVEKGGGGDGERFGVFGGGEERSHWLRRRV
uniref:Uncharacterized protein n=1 Tax=Arundo donax TaxID=35708 RepID=A0A0A9FHA0_ARUDO